MAYLNSTVSFEKMLMKFISEEDPMQSMLKWLCERLMEAEVESKLCAEKSERNKERQGYRSGYRVRRFDTRMGTMYLMCSLKNQKWRIHSPSLSEAKKTFRSRSNEFVIPGKPYVQHWRPQTEKSIN